MNKRTSLLIDLFVIALSIIAGMRLGAEPPLPPQIYQQGRQHPFVTTVTCQHTQVVTQVYEVRYLRTLSVLESNLLETNFVALRTNAPVTVFTNSVFLSTPQ